MSEKGVRPKNIKKDAFRFIDRNEVEIAKIGDAIFYFAELGMQEIRTSEYTAAILQKAGFAVETEIAGVPPAWMATWGSGKPVIAVNAEGDALSKMSQLAGVTEQKPIVAGAPGHVVGHNTNMAVMIGGAVAAKNVMERENIKGTIKIYFCPAKEQLISRPYMLRDGYYDGVDAVFNPTSGLREFSTTYGIQGYASISAEFIFHGTSVGSGKAWLAKNALDALILMDEGWALMRQQLQPSQSSHRVIVEGGDEPGVIPNYTKVWWYFRDKTIDLANANYEKAKKIAEGAAIMTGCSYETNMISTCWPLRANQVMGEIIQGNIEMVGIPRWSKEDEALAQELQKKIQTPVVGLPKGIKPLQEAKLSTLIDDAGCVSWVVPTGRINFPANIPGSLNHQWTAGVALATPIAHKGTIAGAKVLAASMLDLFTDEKLLKEVKESFQQEIGDTKFYDALPKDQKPPVDLNRDEMQRWRPVMEKFYVKGKVRWL